jgi:hypothetical protein
MKTIIRSVYVIVVVFVLSGVAFSARAQGQLDRCNTADGHFALRDLTTGVGDTAFGGSALSSNTTGDNNTAVGCRALIANTTGNGNTATGSQALSRNTNGADNTANGYQALFNNTIGFANTATGHQALSSNIAGVYNTANGWNALLSNTTGDNNTAVGLQALALNTTGFANIALGEGAGYSLTTGDWNIDIGHPGLPDEANTIRIGRHFDPFFREGQNRTFISGIRDIFPEVDDAIPVVIDSFSQLGTTASSSRFKTDIKPMDKASEGILALKPVTFHFKNNAKGRPQFGLIAEEVEKVNPALVVRDRDGQPYTVRYEAVNAMLLNEFLKEHRKVEQLEKQVERLSAGLQKISAQLELRKPSPRTVLNDQ